MPENKTIGQPTAHTEVAELISGKIDVGSAVTTKILDAELVSEGRQSKRISVAISVLKQDAWIKLQPADKDNEKKGIFIQRGQTFVLEASGMYSGEISAISNLADAELYVTVL